MDLCNDEFGSPSGPEADRFFTILNSLRSFAGRTKAAEAVRDELRGTTGDNILGLGLGPNPMLPLCFLDGVLSVRLDGVLSARPDDVFSARAMGVLSARFLIEPIDRAEELLPTERLLVRPEPS